MTLEIDSVLTLSTAHVSEKTAKALEASAESNNASEPYTHPILAIDLIGAVMKWGGYGWMVGVDQDPAFLDPYPDLRAVFAFAKEHGCAWVRLDCDGPTIEALAVYEWEKEDAKPAPDAIIDHHADCHGTRCQDLGCQEISEAEYAVRAGKVTS